MSASAKPDYVYDRVGDVRPSQMLYTFGIGSIVDLQRMSVMVLGLDDWDEAQTDVLSEPRLLQAVQEVHPGVTELRTPPRPKPTQDDRVQQRIGVPVAPFPRWLRCSKCQMIAPVSSGPFKININQYRPEEAEYVHATCQKATGKGKPRAFPVRFLVACEHGHLDDFPWESYVHHGEPCDQGGSSLRLSESGSAGEAADVFVTCNACNRTRPMASAFGASRGELGLMNCTARSPHLRQYDRETCAMPMKAILLGSSHLWFPRVYSALHIPRITDAMDLLINRYQDELATVNALEELKFFRLYRGREFPDLLEHTDEEIWAAIERLREKVEPDEDAGLDLPPSAVIKLPEWEALTRPSVIEPTKDFRLRRVDVPELYKEIIESVVLVERLREVRAFIGFNRWRSMNEFGDVSGVAETEADRLVPIRRHDDPLSWVPAADVRGEGVFIQLREDAVQAWEAKIWHSDWAKEFSDAYAARLKSRGVSSTTDDTATFRRILIHSLSHALMREFALDSGYGAASLQERIYSLAPGHGGAEMAGVLIYTAASDSEGTLGGLVSLGEPQRLERSLDRAIDSMKICSTDPLCAEHCPDTDMGVDLHGAACHTCLFAPETSCEMGNQWLDRAALVETFARRGVELVGDHP